MRRRLLDWRFHLCLATLLLTGASAFPADSAILSNGFSIRFRRLEVRGSMTRLYVLDSTSSYIELPSASIIRIEKDAEEEAPAKNSEPALKAAVPLEEVIIASSLRNRLDPDLVRSLIHAESGFNTNAVSSKGARGLMQLMPQTAREMGVSDLMDPSANIDGGTRYLAGLLSRFNNDPILALSAYNAGPGRVEQYRGVPPYRETRMYVAKVLAELSRTKQTKRATGSGAKPSSGPNNDSNEDSAVNGNSAAASPAHVYP